MYNAERLIGGGPCTDETPNPIREDPFSYQKVNRMIPKQRGKQWRGVRRLHKAMVAYCNCAVRLNYFSKWKKAKSFQSGRGGDIEGVATIIGVSLKVSQECKNLLWYVLF